MNEKVKLGLVVVGWGAMLGSVVVNAIFQGLLLPGDLRSPLRPLDWTPLVWVLFFGLSCFTGIVMGDAGKAILGYFVSVLVAGVVVYNALTLPVMIGRAASPLLAGPVADVALVLTFWALFPVNFLVGLVGAVVGAGLGESLPVPTDVSAA